MYEGLRWVCVLVFTASIPFLVVVRFKSGLPVWFLIILATALGWLLTYAHTIMRHPMMEEVALALRATDPNILIDFEREPYHPVASLAYAPAYFLAWWLAAWLCFRRSSSDQRRRVFLVSVGVLLAEWASINLLSHWAAIIYSSKGPPPDAFIIRVFLNWWDTFFEPPLTLPLAVIVTWLAVVWCPAALAAKSKRPV